jgi:hypothetical protein
MVLTQESQGILKGHRNRKKQTQTCQSSWVEYETRDQGFFTLSGEMRDKRASTDGRNAPFLVQPQVIKARTGGF